MRTYKGLGDSLMTGFNASVQANSWFNKTATAKHRDFHNLGVNGQAIMPGTGTPFNLANIPTKTAFDERLIVNWGLNDTRAIYDLGTHNITDFNTAVQAFLDALAAKGWTMTTQLTWVTGFKIEDNALYTAAEYQVVVDALIVKLIANGVHYITNFPKYPLDAGDNVHPKNDAAYEIMYKYVFLNIR